MCKGATGMNEGNSELRRLVVVLICSRSRNERRQREAVKESSLGEKEPEDSAREQRGSVVQ